MLMFIYALYTRALVGCLSLLLRNGIQVKKKRLFMMAHDVGFPEEEEVYKGPV